MIKMHPGSGHTLRAPHIETPERTFYVKWDSPMMPTAEAGIMWEAAKRWARVLCQTPGGALEIARYHHYMGINHQLMLTPEWPKETTTGG
jgi:hypothetical protein